MTQQADTDSSCYLLDLKAAAESQMRRSAPELDDTGHSNKKQKTSDVHNDKHEHVDSSVSRYSYASQDALISGCKAFLGSCGFRRERSSTKEILAILHRVLPEGTKLQLVKTGCNGLVVIAAEPPEHQQQLSPTAVVQDVLQRMESGDLPQTKFCQRIMPADTTCALTATALKQALTSVVSSYVAQHLSSKSSDAKQPLKFAVAYKNRDNVTVGCKAEGQQQQPAQQQQQQQSNQPQRQQQQAAGSGILQAVPQAELVDRAKAIEIAAAVMQDCCADSGGAKVDLVDPQVVLLLEVVPLARHQLACAVAALPGSMVLTKPKLVVKPTAAGVK